MKPVSLAIIATVAVFAAASVSAEQAPALETSIAAARKAEQSFNTGDAESFSQLYTKEAIFVFDGNTVFEGRDAARDAFTRYFADHPGASLKIAVADARWLTPGVLADSGFATVTKADGSTETTRFSSVAVQENGALRIARLEETPISPDEGAARIAELEWLVGSWQDAEHPETTSSVTLTHNRRFLSGPSPSNAERKTRCSPPKSSASTPPKASFGHGFSIPTAASLRVLGVATTKNGSSPSTPRSWTARARPRSTSSRSRATTPLPGTASTARSTVRSSRTLTRST